MKRKKIATKKYQYTLYPEVLSSFANCPSHAFYYKGTIPGPLTVPSCHVALGSFDLGQCLSHSLTFTTLTILKLLSIRFVEFFSM